MQKGPTRQHIIPKMYLKRFADKEQAWVVDFHSDSEPYKTTLGNILCLKDFYTVGTKLENKDYSIEKKFAEIESDADHVWQDVSCDICNKDWTDIYNLADVESRCRSS